MTGKQFIIWTMQRSGGTSLTRFLKTWGEYSKVLHEPFNGNQIFGHVKRELAGIKSQKEAIVRGQELITEIYDDNPNCSIKHCFEVHSDSFNEALLLVTREKGIKNIFLTRDSNFNRNLSLELAKITGAWSKQQKEKLENSTSEPIDSSSSISLDIPRMLTHNASCIARSRALREKFRSSDNVVRLVYERLYDGELENRLNYLEGVKNLLDLDAFTVDTLNAKQISLLVGEKQNTQAVYRRIENIEQARQKFVDSNPLNKHVA